MASGEGGSNTTLVRVPGKLGGIAEMRELEIHAGEPERRSMAFTRTASGVCVANLHATNDQPQLATEDVLRAAAAASEWAGGAPLIFGGDLNLRPAEDPEVFRRLAEDFGLDSPTTGAKKIDHVLVRGLEVVALPAQWPAERRELPLDGKALRLSDHAPVEARFAKEDPPVLAN
jgi:endonuclease/exonuclease/phosphatase family metal-dependent hydrolase